MGYGYYIPCFVYGFTELNNSKQISSDFLEKNKIEKFASFANKLQCSEYIYGIKIENLEIGETGIIINDDDMESLKKLVNDAFKLASKSYNFDPPKFKLALDGDIYDDGYSSEYDPNESDDDDDE